MKKDFHLKRTKIVATLGPSSSKKEDIKALYESGVNIFRLNFSHGTHESHGQLIDIIRSLDLNCGILLDTKGPEIRVGEVRDKLPLKLGDKFTMTIKKGVYEAMKKLSVNYEGFINDVDVGDIIVIDSGVIKARCLNKNESDLEFEVIEGQCDITTKRHINLYGKKVSLPTVTEQDWKDIDFGIEKKVDFIALSFVRSEKDVMEVKEHCLKKGLNISIISKIENFESTQNLEDIIKASDGVMVARGDLSCEISFGKVPSIQKKMVALCSYYNKPVIIATHLVLSMVKNIQPTRAEVSDVGNAIFERADAIMTSDETTKSPHPVLVIKTMSKIAKETESNIYSICEKPDCDDCFGVLHRGRLQRSGFESNVSLRRRANKSKKKSDLNTSMESVKRKFSCTSLDVSPNTFKENIISILPFVTDDIECLVAVHNHNDDYIKNIASSRLNIPMFGFTNNKMLCNQMNLIWNVQSVYDEKINEDYVNNMRRVDEFMKERDVIKYLLVGDLVTNGKKCTTIQVRNL